MPDSNHQTDTSKKKRKRGPNSKAACNTCKIRRKKCDETKPACLRCTSSGRTCDFLIPATQSWPTQSSSTSHAPLSLPKAIRPSLPIPSDEVHHFDYFQVVVTEEFSAFFNSNLYKQLVLTTAHHEQFVLNAVLAIGALRRFQLDPSVISPTWNDAAVFAYVTKKYTTASRLLRQSIESGTATWRLAVLGCLIFIAIEVLQGHEFGAILHMKNAVAILKSVRSPDLPQPSTPLSPRLLGGTASPSTSDIPEIVGGNFPWGLLGGSEDLVTAFTRLSVDEYPFFGPAGPTPSVLPTLPLRFESVPKARDSLNSIIGFMYSFFRRCGQNFNTLPLQPLPENISATLSDLKTLLQSWLRKFNVAIVGNTSYSVDIITDILRVQYLCAWIQITTHFFYGQMIYDQYLPQFGKIVDLTSRVVDIDNISWPQSKGPCFTLDVAMVQPLYFVARRCRDGLLRRRALEVMKRTGRAGMYSGARIAKIAEWIVRTEEGDEPLDGPISNERRFQDISFEFDQFTLKAEIWTTRIGSDGALKNISEVLDLSDCGGSPWLP
jgi:hypothetical protein